MQPNAGEMCLVRIGPACQLKTVFCNDKIKICNDNQVLSLAAC